MIEVEAGIRVDAPVGEVFDYVDRPANHVEITPSLTRSEAVEELPNGGKRVAYTYGMAGVGLDGHLEAVEYEPGRRVRWEMTGDIEGEIEWELEPSAGGTEFTYRARYEVPVDVLESVLEAFAERYNERELRTTLENLRSRLEGSE